MLRPYIINQTALLHIQQHFDQLLYRAGFCLDPEFLITTLTCTLGGDCIGFDELSLETSQEGRHSYGENHSYVSSHAGFTYY